MVQKEELKLFCRERDATQILSVDVDKAAHASKDDPFHPSTMSLPFPEASSWSPCGSALAMVSSSADNAGVFVVWLNQNIF